MTHDGHSLLFKLQNLFRISVKLSEVDRRRHSDVPPVQPTLVTRGVRTCGERSDADTVTGKLRSGPPIGQSRGTQPSDWSVLASLVPPCPPSDHRLVVQRSQRRLGG